MTIKVSQFWFRILGVMALSAISSPVFALGMGEAEVRSFMRQPLEVRVKLISRSEAELATVTAGLASADDFAIIGLDRAVLSVPLEFEVHADPDNPYIRVTSRLPVNEPVVQLVVEVVWASGRMIRQYTLFMDPPTFESAAPVPSPSPPPPEPEPMAVEEPVEEYAYEEPAESPFAEQAPGLSPEPTREESLEQALEPDSPREAAGEAVEDAPEPVEPLSVDTGPPFEPEAETELPADVPLEVEDSTADELEVDEAVAGEDLEAAETETPLGAAEPASEAAPETQEETSAVAPGEVEMEDDVEESTASEEVSAEPEADEPATPEETPLEEPAPAVTESAADNEPVDLVYRAILPEPESSGEMYGPVQRGDTLWGIASEWGRENGHSVNQVMLAIQQQNPGAFNRGNINSLRAGAILRMPSDQQVRNLSSRQAMLEVMRQEDLYQNRWDSQADDIPTVADIADTPPLQEPEPAVEIATVEDDSRLELVPPSIGNDSDEPAYGQGNSDDSPGTSGESVVEELARAQEELANAQQENTYLNERIRELEGELASRQAGETGGIKDTGLAEMEQRLEAERLDPDKQEQPVVVIPPSRDEPWYSRFSLWLAGLLVILVAGIIWWLRSRADDDEPDGAVANLGGADKVQDDTHDTSAPPPEADPASVTSESTGVSGFRPDPDEQAVELDSDDPETRLDLARAYISMGDTDAARAILEQVVDTGSEEQAREARGMMDEL